MHKTEGTDSFGLGGGGICLTRIEKASNLTCIEWYMHLWLVYHTKGPIIAEDPFLIAMEIHSQNLGPGSSPAFLHQHLTCICKWAGNGRFQAYLSRFTQQTCCDVPNVRLLQLVVLAIIWIDTHVVKGRDYPVEIEAHEYEAVNHLLIVAAVSVDVDVSESLLGRCEGRRTVQLSPRLPPLSTASASAPSSLPLPLHCLRLRPS